MPEGFEQQKTTRERLDGLQEKVSFYQVLNIFKISFEIRKSLIEIFDGLGLIKSEIKENDNFNYSFKNENFGATIRKIKDGKMIITIEKKDSREVQNSFMEQTHKNYKDNSTIPRLIEITLDKDGNVYEIVDGEGNKYDTTDLTSLYESETIS